MAGQIWESGTSAYAQKLPKIRLCRYTTPTVVLTEPLQVAESMERTVLDGDTKKDPYVTRISENDTFGAYCQKGIAEAKKIGCYGEE